MSLTPGTRLGVYDITAQIGEGGMGQVYRATDTRLKRQVAIKILPPSVAADPDRLARFQREAEVLASLNHPHIAHLYGLERLRPSRAEDEQIRGEGSASARAGGGAPAPMEESWLALIMELVDGDELSEWIRRGPMPLEDALPIAKQIAEALEAAHEQGVIHRDLKPANIKVRADGTVKVLDFGLAKAMDVGSGGAGQNPSMSPTLSIHATQAGMILGTAAYMAPEQARGKAVDKRADIWAFGVVLFEMLTGQRAFGGDDLSDTMANVLKMEPDWQAVPVEAPPRVLQVLRACLQKDPRQRIGDMQSVRLALGGAFDSAASQPVVSPSPVAPPRPMVWIAAFAAALLAAVALSIPAVRYLRETPPPESRLDIVTPGTGQPASFALSPDGRQIVFVAFDDTTSRLWLRSLSTTTAQPLAGTEGATFPFWSPDGRSVGFFAGGSLKRLDPGVGAPQVLAPATNGSGGTWNADGDIVFAPNTTGPLMRVSATGGATVAVTTLGPQQFGHFHPQFLPDGRRLLFIAGGSEDVDGIYLGGLDGTSPTLLTQDFSSGVYAPGGWLLWVRADSLIAQKLDAGRTVLTGEPVTLADGVATDSTSVRSAVSVAATGLVAYRTTGFAQRQLTWFDRSGTTRGVVGEPDSEWVQPRVSADGRRVASVRNVQGNRDLWLLDGARASRFTFDPGQDLFPVWSPDRTRIVYASRRTGLGALFQKLTSGAGEEEQFLSTEQTLSASSWSEDGRFLVYNSSDPKTSADLWVMPMTGEDRKPFVFLKTPFREVWATFSPDGRWVAYHSNESGRPEVYVRPFVPPSRDASTSATAPADRPAGTTAPAAGGQWQVSTGGGILPVWRSDGKELYYLNPDGAMMAAPIAVNGATLEPGAPVMLFPTRIYGGGADIQMGRQYDVTSDGRFLINTLLDQAAAPITVLQHWTPPSK